VQSLPHPLLSSLLTTPSSYPIASTPACAASVAVYKALTVVTGTLVFNSDCTEDKVVRSAYTSEVLAFPARAEVNVEFRFSTCEVSALLSTFVLNVVKRVERSVICDASALLLTVSTVANLVSVSSFV
jgi:hypothetical protein